MITWFSVIVTMCSTIKKFDSRRRECTDEWLPLSRIPSQDNNRRQVSDDAIFHSKTVSSSWNNGRICGVLKNLFAKKTTGCGQEAMKDLPRLGQLHIVTMDEVHTTQDL